MADEPPTIGIDLGTTYCCVACMTPSNTVDIIKNQLGHRTTPSYVFFGDSEVLIGKRAKEEVYMTGENVVYDSKRLIGQKYSSPNVQKNLKKWPFKVVRGGEDMPLIEISVAGRAVRHKPEEISANLLKYMKKAAEERLDCKITNAVITVPAYFNYHQRTATERAGNLAGLNVLRIINEPTAAALSYVHSSKLKGKKNLLIFDLGGGTFDVTIVTTDGNQSLTVRATSGNTYLGGRDFDENLAENIADQLEQKYAVSITTDKDTMRRIRARSEKIKIDLSESVEVQYDILGLVPQTTDAYHTIKRAQFERINQKLFNECLNIVKDCIKDAKMVKTDIDKVILTGGSSRTPKLQDMLKDFFGADKLSKGLDPDEAVAYGAAIQAAILSEDDKKALVPKIIDVTPLSLGVALFGNIMSFMIQRNSQIPVTETKTKVTLYDQQRRITFHIFEGERPLVEHNTKIGSCTLELPPRPPGFPVVISFHINENGVLDVSAKIEDGTYRSLVIHYERQDVQSVSDMLRKAKLNKTVDNAIHKLIEMRTNLKTYCIQVKAICNYDKRHLNDEEKQTLIYASDETFMWLDNHEIKTGDEEEKGGILKRQQLFENICEPILKKYRFDIKNMGSSQFYQFCRKMQQEQ